VTGLAAVVAEASAMDISLEATEMDAESCEAVDFYNPSARPTAHEVTLLSLMVISHVPDRRELSSWVQGVVKQLEEFWAQGISWTPPLSLQSEDGDYEYERQLARDWSLHQHHGEGGRGRLACTTNLWQRYSEARADGRRHRAGVAALFHRHSQDGG
jgi:hypothetical protein